MGLGKPAREEGGQPLGVISLNNFGATGAGDARRRKIKKYAAVGRQNLSPPGQKEQVSHGKMTYAISFAHQNPLAQ